MHHHHIDTNARCTDCGDDVGVGHCCCIKYCQRCGAMMIPDNNPGGFYCGSCGSSEKGIEKLPLSHQNDNEAELCICAYNWRITHYQPHQLRLVLRCLPEYTTELAQRLRNRNITCRLRTPGTIHVTNAESLVKLAHQLGVGPVLSVALHNYAGTWAGTRARKKRLPGAREKQTEAARKVMALIPRPRGA